MGDDHDRLKSRCLAAPIPKIPANLFIALSISADVYSASPRNNAPQQSLFVNPNFNRVQLMCAFINRLFSPASQKVSGASMPTALLRDGWKPYRFPDSEIVVILPQTLVAGFGEDGVLYASSNGTDTDFAATLHTNSEFTNCRELALEFVSDLAAKKGAQVVDVATYRYFADPNVHTEGRNEHNFWVIAIPGAVVVVSLTRAAGSPFPPALESVRAAIPDIIGELL